MTIPAFKFLSMLSCHSYVVNLITCRGSRVTCSDMCTFAQGQDMAIDFGERTPPGYAQNIATPPSRSNTQQYPNVHTPHDQSEPSTASYYEIAVDIPAQIVPDVDQRPLESKSSRIDSWNLPNCEKDMRVTFQVRSTWPPDPFLPCTALGFSVLAVSKQLLT